MALDSYRLKQLESLAQKLGQAWLENSLIEEPNYSEIPQSRGEAYFVQDQMSQFIGKDISGWKVGAVSNPWLLNSAMSGMSGFQGIDETIPRKCSASSKPIR